MVFYADVYFLINFTVDTLALYFAVSASKIASSVKRIIALAAMGALVALVSVLFFGGLLGELLLAAVYFPAVAIFISEKLTLYRRVKVTALFAIFEFLCGGAVSFGYGFLDRHFYLSGELSEAEEPNRRLLILAVLILLSIGIFKLVLLFFRNSATQKFFVVKITLLGKSVTADALVDTGNLLRDSSGMPVILIKSTLAKKIHESFPLSDKELTNLPPELMPRISLLPLRSVGGRGILVGIRVDEVEIISEKGTPRGVIRAIIAGDKEGGTYDGFEALMPAGALDDIK